MNTKPLSFFKYECKYLKYKKINLDIFKRKVVKFVSFIFESNFFVSLLKDKSTNFVDCNASCEVQYSGIIYPRFVVMKVHSRGGQNEDRLPSTSISTFHTTCRIVF
jgi:hypothetical protein